jgi:hypothetical protein
MNASKLTHYPIGAHIGGGTPETYTLDTEKGLRK